MATGVSFQHDYIFSEPIHSQYQHALYRREINFNSHPSLKSFKPSQTHNLPTKRVNWFLFTLSAI